MSHARPSPTQRQGASIVFVLCMIALTLGASYAIVRSEMSSVRIQQNSGRRGLARQAAMQGLSVAMRKMQESGWSITHTLSGSLSATESYQATFTVGDNSLTSSHPDYGDFPYRVTIISTGTSVDSQNPQAKAVHRVRAVMRLVPKQLASSPSDLSTITNYTVFQTRDEDFDVQCPLRIQGRTRIQGFLDLHGYSWSDSIRDRYLDDLRRMRLAGMGDYRVFDGPLEIAYSNHGSSARNWITNILGVSISNAAANGVSPQWTHPGSISTYRLYPGGPSYTVPTVPSTVQNTNLQADPITNPLGIFYRSGSITLGSNTTIRGTLIAGDDVTISGGNVTMQPVELRKIVGSNNKLMLPTLLVADDATVTGNGEPTIDGLVAVWDVFTLDERSQTKSLTVAGNMVAKRFEMAGGVSQFANSSLWWSLVYTLFDVQLNNPPHLRINYFPQWLQQNYGIQMEPKIRFLPATEPVTYAWLTSGGTVYVPGSGDGGGLRWELLDWQDNE